MPNPLNIELLKNSSTFLKKRAVRPLSAVKGQSTSLQATGLVEERAAKKIFEETPIREVQHKTVRSTQQIVYADFKEEQYVSGGAVVFEGHLNKVRADLVPLYFLPWASLNIVSMKIPRAISDDAPKIFFTAALSGCSVFVRGDPHSPVVYHAGVDGKVIDGMAADLWRMCFYKVVKADLSFSGDFGEVNKSDYVFEKMQGGKKTTQLAQNYQTWLKNDLSNRPFRVQSVSPWGCVFGIRDESGWLFYLQQNAMVTTREYIKSKKVSSKTEKNKNTSYYLKGTQQKLRYQEKRGIFGIKSRVYYKEYIYDVPMRVSQFYPKGPSRIDFNMTFKQLHA